MLELWHGATYAFKDLSLCCTAQFLQYFLEKKEKHVTVVVGVRGGHDGPSPVGPSRAAIYPQEAPHGCLKECVLLVLLEQGSSPFPVPRTPLTVWWRLWNLLRIIF